jgi:hypothetical protein
VKCELYNEWITDITREVLVAYFWILSFHWNLRKATRSPKKQIFQPRIETGNTNMGKSYIKLLNYVFGGMNFWWGKAGCLVTSGSV